MTRRVPIEIKRLRGTDQPCRRQPKKPAPPPRDDPRELKGYEIQWLEEAPNMGPPRPDVSPFGVIKLQYMSEPKTFAEADNILDRAEGIYPPERIEELREYLARLRRKDRKTYPLRSEYLKETADETKA